MEETAPAVAGLVKGYNDYLALRERDAAGQKIEVDEIASKVAAFYNWVRNLVDYREGHLLRKRAIERALKRRIFLKDLAGTEIAESLIKEIIRAGYLKNNEVPERKIGKTQKVIDCLIFLLDKFQRSGALQKGNMDEWLLGAGVCAVEETLAPPKRDEILAQTMFETLSARGAVQGPPKMSGADKEVLLFIAVQKTLLRVDDDQLHHRILNFIYPDWGFTTGEKREELADALPEVRKKIDGYIRHPLLPSFVAFCGRHVFAFRILGDLVFGGRSFDNLDKDAAEFYAERRRKEKSRLFRTAFLTVLSFFLSKILVAFAVELPVDVYLLDGVSWPHMVANIFIPPAMMFMVVAAIRLPSERNVHLVTERVRSIALGNYREKDYLILLPRRKAWFWEFLVRLIYIGVFLASLYFIVQGLLRFGFSPTNIGVFVFFTSLIAATGVKIYNQAREMNLERRRTGILMFVLDLFTIPLVTIGRWFIAGLRRFNILVLFFDLIVELPFQFFIEFLDNFSGFLRSKKEEIS